MIDFLYINWWLVIALWVVLFLADHYLTVVAARTHQAVASQHIVYQGGIELNPTFEKEVIQRRWFTRKHLIALLVVIFFLAGLRWAAGKTLFEFAIGVILLQWIVILLRHFENLSLFNDIRRRPECVSGRIEYTYWLMQRLSAFRFLKAAFLFTLAGLSTPGLFFWGGVFACLLQAVRGYQLSKRKFPTAAENHTA